jgi:hypothetical protein
MECPSGLCLLEEPSLFQSSGKITQDHGYQIELQLGLSPTNRGKYRVSKSDHRGYVESLRSIVWKKSG